jgi:uncharacterized membrane-anchored protein YhcB (DUF1043 family)
MIPGSWSIAIQLGLFVGVPVTYIWSRSRASRAQAAMQEELDLLESALPTLHALTTAEVEGWEPG